MRLAASETNRAMGTQSTSDAVQCRITVADTRSIRSLGFAINMRETVRGVGVCDDWLCGFVAGRLRAYSTNGGHLVRPVCAVARTAYS